MATQVKADGLRSGYIKTHDGEKIHYVRKGSGTPLILLHGNVRVRVISNRRWIYLLIQLPLILEIMANQAVHSN